MAMFKQVADIKTADMLDLPVPEVEYHNIAVKPSQVQKEMVASLGERAEKIRGGNVDSSVDNMLKVTNDGRKLALDQRMMNPMLPDEEGSKVNACVNEVFRIWEENSDKKLTQLLFCDLSTPKGAGEFSVYTDIRQKLIEHGIPESEIKFIHEADPESHVSWMSPELFSGETNDDSNRFLECCGEALNRGIDTDDSKLVFEAVRLCMDWAGAFYDFRHGPQKGNETVVKKLFDDGTIVEFMRKSREYILSGNIESLEYYTSGWAIVWYVLDPDKMIILGSREVCGLNKILIDFKKEYNIEKLPREINFGQLVYRDNKRFIEGIKYVYTPKGKLKMYKKILKILNTVKDLGGYACCHEIDRKLFMIGR